MSGRLATAEPAGFAVAYRHGVPFGAAAALGARRELQAIRLAARLVGGVVGR